MVDGHQDFEETSEPEQDPDLSETIQNVRDWASAMDCIPGSDFAGLVAAARCAECPTMARWSTRQVMVGATVFAAACFLHAISLMGVRVEVGDWSIQVGNSMESNNYSTLLVRIEEYERGFKTKQAVLEAEIGHLNGRAMAVERALTETAVAMAETQQLETLARQRVLKAILTAASVNR